MPRAPHRTLLRVGSRHTVSSGSENGATPTKELRRRAPKLARRRGSIVVEASAAERRDALGGGGKHRTVSIGQTSLSNQRHLVAAAPSRHASGAQKVDHLVRVRIR